MAREEGALEDVLGKWGWLDAYGEVSQIHGFHPHVLGGIGTWQKNCGARESEDKPEKTGKRAPRVLGPR